MRGYASLFFFCAVLTFVSPVAPHAAESAAEYRAPVTGAKLGPAQPVQPAPTTGQPQSGALPAAQSGSSSGGQNQPHAQPMAQPPGQPEFSGQPAAPAQPSAPQAGAAGVPAPWPSAGGMMPYSSLGARPGPDAPPAPSDFSPAAPASTGADMAGSAAAPGAVLPPAPGYAPNYVPDYAPAPSQQYAPAYGGQGDRTYGTSQLQGDNFNDRGIATQYRDPQTGDIITSVVPPSPPDQQNYGTIFVAPQIYPDGNQWGGNPHGPMPRPGQPYMPPAVIWQPGIQPGMQPDHNRHRHSDRGHNNRRHDDRYDAPTPVPPPAPYQGPHSGPRDYRGGAYGGGDSRHEGAYGNRAGDRYDTRPGQQGNSPYDQRDADRSRDGRERR